MDWKECRDNKFVKKVGVDEDLINSLIKSSKKRLESNRRLDLDATTASTKISIIYESLREILEALALRNNFKIYNHECFCAFLDEIWKNKFFSRDFDKFRKIRNQINYYGKDIFPAEAKTIIKEIILLREEIINKYFRELK